MRLFRGKQKRIEKTTHGKLVRILIDRNTDVFFDVGANTGQTGRAIRLAGYSGRIISFEPVPKAHAELTKAAANDPLWEVVKPTAIGEFDGEIEINVSKATDMSSILEPTDNLLLALPRTQLSERLLVPIRRLDTILPELVDKKMSNMFLKIDTQGYERNVLNGAHETLSRFWGLQMELSLFSLYEGEETYLSFLNDLHALAMYPLMIVETNFSKKLMRQLQIDIVFAKS